MADDVTLPGTGAVVETLQQADGSHRQVIALGAAESAALIGALKQIANPTSFDPATGSMRIVATAGTISAVTTVSAVTNLAQVGGITASVLVDDMMRTAWANAIRGRIT